jgi:hypothetical protein
MLLWGGLCICMKGLVGKKNIYSEKVKSFLLKVDNVSTDILTFAQQTLPAPIW